MDNKKLSEKKQELMKPDWTENLHHELQELPLQEAKWIVENMTDSEIFSKVNNRRFQEDYIAIARNRKVRTPEYPPITIYRWDEVAYETGITHTVIEGITVPVYDIEKSVCDAIKHRNKIGIDVSSEILKNYLSRKTRDIDKLMKYAKIMRVASTIKKYLEIQL